MKISIKNPVYLVLLDEVYDGDTGDCTAYIFDSREKAEKQLAELYKIGKEMNRFDVDDSAEGDYVDLYTEGFYSRDHYHARIEKREIE